MKKIRYHVFQQKNTPLTKHRKRIRESPDPTTNGQTDGDYHSTTTRLSVIQRQTIAGSGEDVDGLGGNVKRFEHFGK